MVKGERTQSSDFINVVGDGIRSAWDGIEYQMSYFFTKKTVYRIKSILRFCISLYLCTFATSLLIPMDIPALCHVAILFAWFIGYMAPSFVYSVPNQIDIEELYNKNLRQAVGYSLCRARGQDAYFDKNTDAGRTVLANACEEAGPCDDLHLKYVYLDNNEKLPYLVSANFDYAKPSVILLRHNVSNIFEFYKRASDIAKALNCNIFVPEYIGYGITKGSPDKFAINSAFDKALHCFQDEYGLDFKKTSIMGYGFGNAPAVSMVSSMYRRDIKIINAVGIYSTNRVLTPAFAVAKFFRKILEFILDWTLTTEGMDWRPGPELLNIGNRVTLIRGLRDYEVSYDDFVQLNRDLAEQDPGRIRVAITLCAYDYWEVIRNGWIGHKVIRELLVDDDALENYIRMNHEACVERNVDVSNSVTHLILTSSNKLVFAMFDYTQGSAACYKAINRDNSTDELVEIDNDDYMELKKLVAAHGLELDESAGSRRKIRLQEVKIEKVVSSTPSAEIQV